MLACPGDYWEWDHHREVRAVLCACPIIQKQNTDWAQHVTGAGHMLTLAVHRNSKLFCTAAARIWSVVGL